MSDSKIQIKVGIVEFSGEGNQDWLADQLDKILAKVPELLKIEMAAPQTNNLPNGAANLNGGGGQTIQLSMTNVAAKLGSKSGQDLATAAGAYLCLVKGKSTFTRNEILAAMKDATGYYKKSFGSNLTNVLGGLIKTTFTESAKDTFSLQVSKVQELNAILTK